MSRPFWTFFCTVEREGSYLLLKLNFAQACTDIVYPKTKAGGCVVYRRSTATDALVISFLASDGGRNVFNESTSVSDWGSMKVSSSGITKANARALTRIASEGRHMSPTELVSFLRAVHIEYDEDAGGHVLTETESIPVSPKQLKLDKELIR